MLYVHKILIALITSEVLFFVNSEQSSNSAHNQQSMSDPAVDIERDPNLVGGFLKGLSVIEAFDSDTSRLAIADVSKATGLDRATCRRLLLTLVHAGYAQFDGKFFSLAPSVLRLGYAYIRSASLPNTVQPFVEKLSREIEESCSGAILEGDHIVYIARASQRRVMSINLGVGSKVPAYCSSMGRVLLASLESETARQTLSAADRPRVTPKTRIAVRDIMAELDQVRRQGYALVDEELELGLRSIAVPIRNMRNEVVAAMNVGTQSARVAVERMINEFLPPMQQTAASISRVLP